MERLTKQQIHEFMMRERSHDKPLGRAEEYRREQESSDARYKREIGWQMIKDNQRKDEKR